MTSTVTVTAHCGPEREVQILVGEGNEILEEIVLQDGEHAERYVYNERFIRVVELEKE
jgi:hypothetical protein